MSTRTQPLSKSELTRTLAHAQTKTDLAHERNGRASRREAQDALSLVRGGALQRLLPHAW